MSLYNTTVDVDQVDDAPAGPRGGRGQGATRVLTGVRCRVNEIEADAAKVGGRETPFHKFRIQFPDPVRLGPTHRIHRVDPATGQPQVLKVVATRERKAPSMPDVVYALLSETAQ